MEFSASAAFAAGGVPGESVTLVETELVGSGHSTVVKDLVSMHRSSPPGADRPAHQPRRGDPGNLRRDRRCRWRLDLSDHPLAARGPVGRWRRGRLSILVCLTCAGWPVPTTPRSDTHKRTAKRPTTRSPEGWNRGSQWGWCYIHARAV